MTSNKIERFFPYGDYAIWYLQNIAKMTNTQIAERIGTSVAMVSKYGKYKAIPSKGKQRLLQRVLEEAEGELAQVEREGAKRGHSIHHMRYIVSCRGLLKEVMLEYSRNLDK